jgi:hypothetical protein
VLRTLSKIRSSLDPLSQHVTTTAASSLVAVLTGAISGKAHITTGAVGETGVQVHPAGAGKGGIGNALWSGGRSEGVVVGCV